MNPTERPDRNPAIAELLDDAYVVPVDVETAARHLWVIHSAARQMEEEAAALAELEAAVAKASAPRRRVPRAAVPVLALMMMLSSSGVAVAASQDSLPGDVLYPVKRGAERAQLLFARDPVSRAELRLHFAQNRLDEIRQIADTRPQHVPELVAEITVTVSEVEQSAPEVVAVVGQVASAIRQETTQSVADLDLPEDISAEAANLLDAADGATDLLGGTATPVPTTGSSTATDAPSDGATPSDEPSGEPSDEPSGEPLDGILVDPDATAEPTPSPSPSPSASPSPEPSGTPSDEPDGGLAFPPGTGTTGSTDSGEGGDGSETPSDQPTSTETDSESESDEDLGPVVTTRPHGDGGEPGGENRDDEGEPEPVVDEPYTRPTS